jgi:hypothetical protein
VFGLVRTIRRGRRRSEAEDPIRTPAAEPQEEDVR